MCMVDDADMVTVLSDQLFRARKVAKCMECGRSIQTGELYKREGYLFEGAISTHRTCAQCLVCREWLVRECRGFLYSGIYEDLSEHFTESDYPSTIKRDLGRLIVGMRRQWDIKRFPRLPLTTKQLQPVT